MKTSSFPCCKRTFKDDVHAFARFFLNTDPASKLVSGLTPTKQHNQQALEIWCRTQNPRKLPVHKQDDPPDRWMLGAVSTTGIWMDQFVSSLDNPFPGAVHVHTLLACEAHGFTRVWVLSADAACAQSVFEFGRLCNTVLGACDFGFCFHQPAALMWCRAHPSQTWITNCKRKSCVSQAAQTAAVSTPK